MFDFVAIYVSMMNCGCGHQFLKNISCQTKPFSYLRMESSPVENLRDPSPVDARRLLTSGAVPSALLDCKGVCDT